MTVPPWLLDPVLVGLSRLVMRRVILRLGHLCNITLFNQITKVTTDRKIGVVEEAHLSNRSARLGFLFTASAITNDFIVKLKCPNRSHGPLKSWPVKHYIKPIKIWRLD